MIFQLACAAANERRISGLPTDAGCEPTLEILALMR